MWRLPRFIAHLQRHSKHYRRLAISAGFSAASIFAGAAALAANQSSPHQCGAEGQIKAAAAESKLSERFSEPVLIRPSDLSPALHHEWLKVRERLEAGYHPMTNAEFDTELTALCVSTGLPLISKVSLLSHRKHVQTAARLLAIGGAAGPSEADINALLCIRLYTLESPRLYAMMNTALRERNLVALKPWTVFIQHLYHGLRLLPPHRVLHAHQVYRGVRLPHANLRHFLMYHKLCYPGTEEPLGFCFGQFTSTSLLREKAADFKTPEPNDLQFPWQTTVVYDPAIPDMATRFLPLFFKLQLGPGAVGYHIIDFSYFNDLEQEVLIPPFQRFCATGMDLGPVSSNEPFGVRGRAAVVNLKLLYARASAIFPETKRVDTTPSVQQMAAYASDAWEKVMAPLTAGAAAVAKAQGTVLMDPMFDDLKAQHSAAINAKAVTKDVMAVMNAEYAKEKIPIRSLTEFVVQTKFKSTGANPIWTAERLSDQSKWLIKEVKSDALAANEVLAARLYQLAGVRVPALMLCEDPQSHRLVVASKFEESLAPLQPSNMKGPNLPAGLLDGFVFDCWLANWDVAGLTYDNVGVVAAGAIDNQHAIRVDVGGSLLFRGMGQAKGAAFGPQVTELTSLRDPAVNAQTSQLFVGLTPTNLSNGVHRLRAISDESIRDACTGFTVFLDSTQPKLADLLISRKNNILHKFPQSKL